MPSRRQPEEGNSHPSPENGRTEANVNADREQARAIGRELRQLCEDMDAQNTLASAIVPMSVVVTQDVQDYDGALPRLGEPDANGNVTFSDDEMEQIRRHLIVNYTECTQKMRTMCRSLLEAKREGVVADHLRQWIVQQSEN